MTVEVSLARVVESPIVKRPGYPIPYVALEQVELEIGRLVARAEVPERDPSDAARFEAGDVLFGKLRPYLDKVVHCDFEGCCSTELLVLRPRPDLADRFLYYIALSKPFVAWADATSYGTKMPRTSWEWLRRLRVSLPNIGKQRDIAKFLDRETERIDRLVQQKRQLIELLQEKRSALISHAVTKGLDPTVPMRDSGIQWFGEMPTHWRLERLRRVIRRFVDYRGKTPSKVDDGVLIVTARNVRDGAIDLYASMEYMRSEDYASWMVRGFPKVGDVILTTEAPLGQIAQIEDATVALAQRIILLKAATTEIRNDFLAYALRSQACQSELASRATGSTAVGIKADRLRDVLVPVPPLDEQDWIDGHLAQRSESIGAANVKLEHQLVKLTEYRQALITAAVTGQIDVSVETPEPEEVA